jgi:pimeloyl-ACP methyl ester carboxylesterase
MNESANNSRKQPKLILLHGALGTDEQMDALAQSLSEHFAIRNLLFNGHGAEQAGAAFNIEELSEQLLLELNGEKALVFGYSMGGYVALAAASRAPELFEGVITLGTKFDWSPQTLEKELAQLNPDKIQEKVPQFAAMLEKRHGERWPQMVIETAAMMQHLSSNYSKIESQWSEMKTRVLMLLGDQDKMVTQHESARAAEKIPNAVLKILPNTPHQIERANVELISAEILQFLT